MAESSVEFLAEVARALKDMLDRMVFVGGAIAPLLHVDRLLRAPRPTKDVDAIAVTTSYSAFDRLCERLRERGFRQDVSGGHAHRWTAPGPHSVPFDLVPVGGHLGASGNAMDRAAMETAIEAEIEPGLVIRHASATGFLALKLSAFRDRGVEDPHASSDLEDIFALVAARPDIASEVAIAPELIRAFVRAEAAELLERGDFEDLIGGHLRNVDRHRSGEVLPAVEARLKEISGA